MSEETKQQPLFGEIDIERQEPWRNEWQGMPEFYQTNLAPYKSIKVHFKNRSDFMAFANTLNRKLSDKTRSIWYPEKITKVYTDKAFVDES